MSSTFASSFFAPSPGLCGQDPVLYASVYRDYLKVVERCVIGGVVLPVGDGQAQCSRFRLSALPCGVDGDYRDGLGDQPFVVEEKSCGTVDEVVDGGEGLCASAVSGVEGRGINWERNKENREKKKQRKLKRQQIGEDWRVRRAVTASVSSELPAVGRWVAGEQVSGQCREGVSLNVEGRSGRVDSGRRGFFSGCSEEVQSHLRESRARLLIAENERKAVEEEKKLKRLSSPEALVQEMIRVTRMANQLKKQTVDVKIGGWAETVADGLMKSVAESAPSTIPSLESVGYGKSALKSSGDGDHVVDEKRKWQYERALMEVERSFGELEVESDEDHEYAIARVKEEYSDVAFTPKELERIRIREAFVAAMVVRGFGINVIDDIVDDVNAGCF